MAAVTYDNGYETVYSELVVPGNKVTRPATESVKKYYMDAEDISYVDANGVAFDFPLPSKTTQKLQFAGNRPSCTIRMTPIQGSSMSKV